ncbi:hypothetical protein KI387_001766, partial [Taxus chinensis]
MFYSQFVLAKKGPLGTIWIAAHLERKLKKNQVADTDIGVSVDSILFPEVPIALRLSSHLLLGVVRIYSRKVNYLFNDCSETLVKIKQAFHSTAVDLPPEASTAPYHSITLPETFDLDDLELPESSFSHGNFVDHHVTTREQITLQDPVEDTIYLGSQFGLDERFGDGDAPQIGLEFDEDLFADQICSPGPSSVVTHLEEDVLPSVLGVEGTFSNKMEINGQQLSIPAVDPNHLDEDNTRDHSTIQSPVDVDIPNVLPPPVEVVHASSREVHTPDLNKEIFPCSTLQGPSTPRLTDETLNAQSEGVPISSSLQKIQVFNSVEGIVTVVTSQAFATASCSVSGLSTGFEQVDKSVSSQDHRSALTTLPFEERREADKTLNKEQGQPDEKCLKERLFARSESILKEVPQHSTTFQTCENVNLFPSPNPVQPVMMKTSRDMPAVTSNSQCTASPTCSLALPTVPLPHVHYELHVSKQQLPIQEIHAPTNSMQLENADFRVHDVSTLRFQQLNEVGDGKKQLHLESLSEGLVQIPQMHNNQMLHTPVEQSPAMETFSTCLSSQLSNPASGLQSAVGTSGTRQSSFYEAPTSAAVVPNMQDVSPAIFQQKSNVAESRQQLQFSARPQEYAPVTNMQSSMMNTHVHQHSTGAQESPIHEFPALATAISNTQNVPTMENSQHLYQVAGSKQQICLEAATQESAQLTQRENFVVNTSAQELNQSMLALSPSDEHINKSSSHQSAVSMSDTQQIPLSGNTAGPAHVASQNVWSPQRFHRPENSVEVSNIAAIEGPWLHACNEEAKIHQSISSIHGAVHDGSHTRESTAIFSSSDIQRIPTNVPVQNTYPQSASFSILTGVQGVSKDILDGSTVAQSPSLIHGAQHGGSKSGASDIQRIPANVPSKSGEPAANVPSTDIQRIPTSIPVQNMYTQSSSFSMPAGVQGFSKGILDGSIVAQSSSSIHGVQHGGSKTGESAAVFPSSDMQRIPANVPVHNMYQQGTNFSIPIGVQGVYKGILDGSIAAQSTSLIHGAQHGDSKTGESAAIFPSSDMQRIPTNVPVYNTYSQSASFSIPTGVQGVSKGIIDGSIAAQSTSLIHGAQHGGSNNGESAAIFPSSSMQRIPTNAPVKNTYPQIASFSIPTGMQGVPQGILDRSIAEQSISLIHGAQHGAAKPGESAVVFPSSDMHRIPTNVPVKNMYPQSASFAIPTGVQGVSKGILDARIATLSTSSIHGAQHGGSRTGESAAIFPSSDMQRIPTNVSAQNMYQSASFPTPIGVQGVSKGILDGSIAAQHHNFSLEKETLQSHTDVLSGNISRDISFPLQAPTLGTCADVPSRNILQPCSFSTHAGTNGVYANVPSESTFLQETYPPKVKESEGFPSNFTASKKSSAATFQHQAFANASDELSNALSINQAQDATACKGKQFETMQPHLEAIRRSEMEISAHETLRSSYNVGRNEADIFGLMQPTTVNETPREVGKNTITPKQSAGSRKRHIMDTIPVLKEVTPKSRSRLSMSNRSMDYIPHDDDVLASILGRTPSFKIKPTPAETVTAKRRRPTPRTTGLKRKALIDIAMVIHGDVIRQQLVNTEDIRRVRKKAPCTPQEIRMIQKDSQAHYIFFEPSIPGLCMELHDLYGQVFGLTEGKLPQVGKNEIFTETQKEREPTSSLEPTNASRMLHLQRAERPLEIVSEMGSSVQQVCNAHANDVDIDCVNGSRVHMDDDHGKQEHDRPLDMVSEIISRSVPFNNVHDKQEPEKPVKMGIAVGSSRVHMNDSHKEQEQERLRKSVSEVESSRVHVYDVRQNWEQEAQTIVREVESNQVHMGDVHQKQEQERPWMVVSNLELGRVLPDTESSRVLTVSVNEKEDQERSQGMASEMEYSKLNTFNVHQKQEREQERPQEIVLGTESSRMHAYDVQGRRASMEALPENPINVIGYETSNVKKALESSEVQQDHTLSEIASSRVHTLDVHKKREREQERPQAVVLEIESSRLHAYDVQGKQAPVEALRENSVNVLIGSEVSNVEKTLESSVIRQGHTLSEIELSRVHTLDAHWKQEREQERPRETVFEIESSRVHADAVQGKEASVEALLENPINAIIGPEVSNVNRTLESMVVQQPRFFSNEVFVPQGYTFGDCQVPGAQDSSVLKDGCYNTREIYLASHQFPLKSSCFSENHEMPLEVKGGSQCLAGKHGIAVQDMEASQSLAEKHGVDVWDMEVSQCVTEKRGVAAQDMEVSQRLSQNHSVAVQEMEASQCLTKNRGEAVQDMEVSQCLAENQGVSVQDMEVSQYLDGNCRVNGGEKILSEDLEVAVMMKDGSNSLVENHGLHVVHVSEISKINEGRELKNKEPNIAQDRKEETVKDYEPQKQPIFYNALTSMQGTDSVPYNNVHVGDLGDLNMSGKASVQYLGVENTKPGEQVLVYEKSTEMLCNEAEVPGDVALRDREGMGGLNQVNHTVTEDDEEFGFLGDADDTEFMEGDGNAQDEFNGKTKAPDTEEDQIQENSGWSARTRAVSRYLKTAFESMDYDSKKPEAENRQKLSLDHLLVGKRRKEAARMFFETL